MSGERHMTMQEALEADGEKLRQLTGDGDDWDLICDLVKNGDIIEDVCIRRQDLEIIRRTLSTKAPPHD